MNKDVLPAGSSEIRRLTEATKQRSFEVVLSPDLLSDGVARLAHAFAGERVLMVTTPSVAIDIALSAALAAELDLLECDVRNRIVALLRDVGLPTWSPLLTQTLAEQSLHDMQLHRGGCVNLVIPTGIGSATFLREVDEIPNPSLRAALTWLRTQFNFNAEADNSDRARQVIPLTTVLARPAVFSISSQRERYFLECSGLTEPSFHWE